MKNLIVLKTVQLLRAIRNADDVTIKEAAEELKAFGDSWLLEGSMKPLQDDQGSCLADTDITEPLRETLEARASE